MKRETVFILICALLMLLTFGSVDIEEVDHDTKTAHTMFSD